MHARTASGGAPARERRARTRSTVVLVLLVVTALVVGAIVFAPNSPDASGQQALAAWLMRMHRTWMPGWVTFDVIEFAANVAMFTPLGLFAALVLPRHRPLGMTAILAACVAFSGGIEFFQHALLPGRDGSWSDVVANGLGAAVGVLLAAAVARRSAGRAAGRR